MKQKKRRKENKVSDNKISVVLNFLVIHGQLGLNYKVELEVVKLTSIAV